jgi:hypothetical protein
MAWKAWYDNASRTGNNAGRNSDDLRVVVATKAVRKLWPKSSRGKASEDIIVVYIKRFENAKHYFCLIYKEIGNIYAPSIYLDMLLEAKKQALCPPSGSILKVTVREIQM